MCYSQLKSFLSYFPIRNHMQMIRKMTLIKYNKSKKNNSNILYFTTILKDGHQLVKTPTALSEQQQCEHNWLQMEVHVKGKPFHSAGICLCWRIEKLGTISSRHNSKTRKLLESQDPIFTLAGVWWGGWHQTQLITGWGSNMKKSQIHMESLVRIMPSPTTENQQST